MIVFCVVLVTKTFRDHGTSLDHLSDPKNVVGQAAQGIIADFEGMMQALTMMLPFRLLGSRFEVMNFMSMMILGLMCPMMPWALCLGHCAWGVHTQILLVPTDDMMQGHDTLLH